jgi:hypothetical protein
VQGRFTACSTTDDPYPRLMATIMWDAPPYTRDTPIILVCLQRKSVDLNTGPYPLAKMDSTDEPVVVRVVSYVSNLRSWGGGREVCATASPQDTDVSAQRSSIRGDDIHPSRPLQVLRHHSPIHHDLRGFLSVLDHAGIISLGGQARCLACLTVSPAHMVA